MELGDVIVSHVRERPSIDLPGEDGASRSDVESGSLVRPIVAFHESLLDESKQIDNDGRSEMVFRTRHATLFLFHEH